MPLPDRPRRRLRGGLLGLLLAGTTLGAAAAGPGVAAQDAPGDAGDEVTGDELFGGYTLTSRANGVQLTYDAVGLFPVSPIMQFSVPEALATLSSGPSGYGLASLAFPGPLIADLGTVIALADDRAPDVPGYPIRQEAFFPSGPTEAEQGMEDGTVMRAETTPSSSAALARYTGTDAPPIVTVGTVTSASRSSIEDGRAVTRARSELNDIAVLGGVVTIDSVVTDLVAVNDATGAASDGSTTVSGVRFLGLAATLDERGLVLTEAPPAPEDGPVPDPGLPLGDVAEGLEAVTDPLNDLLGDVLSQAVPSVNELLGEAGVTIEVLEPVEVVGEGSVSRTAGGVVIDVRYVGQDQEGLNELVNSLPPDLRQSLGPLPNPVNLLVETHLTTLGLAPASVTSTASPLFVFDMAPFVPPADLGEAAPAPAAATAPHPGFSTAAPAVPRTAPVSSPGTGGAELRTSPVAALLSGAVPAFLVLAVVLGAPLFGLGTTRLADNVLAPVSRACPQGLDGGPSLTTPPDPGIQ